MVIRAGWSCDSYSEIVFESATPNEAYLLLGLLHCGVVRPEIHQKRPAAKRQRLAVHPAGREERNETVRFLDLFVDGDCRGDDVAFRTIDKSVQNVDLGVFGTETLLEKRLLLLQGLDFVLFFLQVLDYTQNE